VFASKDTAGLTENTTAPYCKRQSAMDDPCLKEMMDFLTLLANFSVAFFTGLLALMTYLAIREGRKGLAQQIDASEKNTREQIANWEKNAKNQIGVQTWLALEARFDSNEMRLARRHVAQQLINYVNLPQIHDAVQEIVFELLESISTVYNLGLLNTDLAISSFGYYIANWWSASESYIKEERKRQGNDVTLYEEFEKFAMKMKNGCPQIEPAQVRRFLNAEATLRVVL
jgi:hypothetical protein